MTRSAPLIVSHDDIPRDKELDQFFTKEWLAQWLVEWVGLKDDDVVLEPAAGHGAIVRGVPKHIAVVACEIDARFYEHLTTTGHQKIAVFIDDFLRPECLEVIARYHPTVSVQNPPYSKPHEGIDSEFIQASLQLCPRVVALVSEAIFSGKRRHKRIWSYAVLNRVVHLVDRPRFDSGEGMQPRTNYCVIDIRRPNYPGELANEVKERWVFLDEIRRLYDPSHSRYESPSLLAPRAVLECPRGE